MMIGTLAAAGTSMAIAQLSLNVAAAEAKARVHEPITNGCHGFWSIGMLIGLAVGAIMALSFAFTFAQTLKSQRT